MPVAHGTGFDRCPSARASAIRLSIVVLVGTFGGGWWGSIVGMQEAVGNEGPGLRVEPSELQLPGLRVRLGDGVVRGDVARTHADRRADPHIHGATMPAMPAAVARSRAS